MQSASGAVFTVTSTSDSGGGSLRQAIVEANSSPGTNRIAFDLPGQGPHTIQLTSDLPYLNGPVVIDGRTQPGFGDKPVVEINGSALEFGVGFTLSSNSVLQGLVINGFESFALRVAGAGTVVRGNFIGLDRTGTGAIPNGGGIRVFSPDTLIGGTNEGDRNVISGNTYGGIALFSPGNRVAGNFIGTDWTGTALVMNSQFGVSMIGVAGSSNVIGGAAHNQRNIITGNAVQITGAFGNVIEGNFIGTDVTGATSIGGSSDGITVSGDAAGNIIVGNVISGNGGNGVVIEEAGTGNLIQGNLVGAGASGVGAVPNGSNGVMVVSSSQQVIGGIAEGEGNVIAYNGGNGVYIKQEDRAATNNIARGNRIFGNAAGGIDLGGDGSTPNDRVDADRGANNLQNHPAVVSAATNIDNTLSVSGVLESGPTSPYFVDVLANVVCGISGCEEGQILLGTTNLFTDHTGKAVFLMIVDRPQAEIVSITALATDRHGNTSEFAPPGTVNVPAVLVTGGNVGEGDSGSRTVAFEVHAVGTTNLTLSFETLSGTAVEGVDFFPTNGVLYFESGPASQIVFVPVAGDVLDESDEEFYFQISAAGSVVRATARIVDDDTGTLAMTQQPGARSVRPGADVTFDVEVVSSTPVTYQWRRDGVDIPGATAARLNLVNVQYDDDGLYSVLVVNNEGTYESNPARLTVLVNPLVIQHPLSQEVVAGGSVTFSASVFGNPSPFTYEWRRVSTALEFEVSGETNSFFTLSNVTTNDAGLYRVTVRNEANPYGISSGLATLTVLSDTDGDRIPDVWEISYGFNATNAIDATVDADNDGLGNREEYVAGTNPNDALSTLRLSLDHVLGCVEASFQATSNRTYTIQSSDSLNPATWSTLADIVAQPLNGRRITRDCEVRSTRFYRVITPRSE